jgi:hypothetical protein
MTGQELIDWIIEHGAQDMECIVQYRDSGGSYLGGETIEHPVMASFKGTSIPYSNDVEITYGNGLNPNCVVL